MLIMSYYDCITPVFPYIGPADNIILNIVGDRFNGTISRSKHRFIITEIILRQIALILKLFPFLVMNDKIQGMPP